MPKGKELSKRLVSLLELPNDVALNLPLMRVTGNDELFLENYKGIVEYSEQLLRIRTNQGMLRLEGVKLVLGYVTTENLLIKGKISRIEFLS